MDGLWIGEGDINLFKNFKKSQRWWADGLIIGWYSVGTCNGISPK